MYKTEIQNNCRKIITFDQTSFIDWYSLRRDSDFDIDTGGNKMVSKSLCVAGG